MEKFESWNKLRGIDFRIRFSPPKQFEAYVEQERQDSWKAALGWALSSGSWENIVYNIKEELKNRKT